MTTLSFDFNSGLWWLGKGQSLSSLEQKNEAKEKKICCWRRAMAGKDSMKQEEMEKSREARYLLPCLSESKRCRKVENRGRQKTQTREKEGKVEETRASYCD